MKETQELLIENHRYPIYKYQGDFRRDEKSKELVSSIILSIPAINIAQISPWIMKNKGKKDITIIRHLSKNSRPFNTIYMDFIDVRCNSYSEEYDTEWGEVVLTFTANFENRIITDRGERQKLNKLLV